MLIPSSAPLDPVVATTGGDVLIFYQELQTHAITLHVLRSTDHGTSFGPPVTIGAAAEAALPGAATESKSGWFIPTFAAAASPASGALYAAISGFSRQAGHPRILIWASASYGTSWNRPVSLDDPATASLSQLQPRLAVSPAGTVRLLYLAEARDSAVTVNLAQSLETARHFQAGHRLDTFCAVPGEWLGDYQGLTATSTTIAVWNSQPVGRLELLATALPAHTHRP